MFSTSGPSVPLFTSASDFLPVARLVSSNFFSAMELVPQADATTGSLTFGSWWGTSRQAVGNDRACP